MTDHSMYLVSEDTLKSVDCPMCDARRGEYCTTGKFHWGRAEVVALMIKKDRNSGEDA